MFGLSKQVDSVQSEEPKFDSIPDIKLLVFFIYIDIFKMHGSFNNMWKYALQFVSICFNIIY